MRLATANIFDNGLENLIKRQTQLSSLQEQLSTGKKVNRASDDPTATAQAERAMTRLSRIDTDQRALELQRNAIGTAESTLGDAAALMQNFRELVIAAGNAAYNPRDRASLAQQLAGLRDQMLTLANRTDGNGIPVFGGLASSSTPYADLSSGVVFQGSAGQRAASATSLPGTMNGQAIWMDVPSGNGTFKVALDAANTGTGWTDPGNVIAPSALTGNDYRITFNVVAGVTTYDVVNSTTSATVASGQPYTDGAAIQFDGMSVIMHGAPQNADAVAIAPSTIGNVFQVLDDAIAGIDNQPGDNRLAQSLALSLAQVDGAFQRLVSARSQAGDWLNRADTITDSQSARAIALEAEKSRAINLDMVKGLSDFNLTQTGYQAALQSYAQIQKLSLFNFIN